MHPNRKFHISDRAVIAGLVRDQGFGTLVATSSEGLRAVHLPVLLDGDRVRFHVSKGNQIHSALAAEAEALLIVNGPHAYVSPDFYGLEDRVPTWNYVAVELAGRVTELSRDALVRLLDDMSDHHEARLAPKTAWKRIKMSEGRFDGLLKAITGFEMEIADWRGTMKLDQDKPEEVRTRVADALDRHGEKAMSRLMRP